MFIDKQAEEALCVLLNEEKEQYEEFLMMEEFYSWLLQEYEDFWYEDF